MCIILEAYLGTSRPKLRGCNLRCKTVTHYFQSLGQWGYRGSDYSWWNKINSHRISKIKKCMPIWVDV